MDSAPEKLIRFYYKRGSMENFIKESKNAQAADRYHSLETAEDCCKSSAFSKIYHIQAFPEEFLWEIQIRSAHAAAGR